jgi:hypothetical protein
MRALLNFPKGTLFNRASRDPDNVPVKAGNQRPHDVIDRSLDSGHPPPADSGMTGSEYRGSRHRKSPFVKGDFLEVINPVESGGPPKQGFNQVEKYKKIL